MKNLSNNFLGLMSLLIVPAVMFGLTLGYTFKDPTWYFTLSARITWIILCCLISGVSFGTLLYRCVSSKWSEWTLYKADQHYTLINYCNPLLGQYEVGRDSVIVDIYERTHENGLKEYKRVIKYK